MRSRPEKKGRDAIIIEHLTTLSYKKFAEEARKDRKVIPIASARRNKLP